jgi:hypothetical protein
MSILASIATWWRNVSTAFLLALLLAACASPQAGKPAPSVAGVKSSITEARSATREAQEASLRSSGHIRELKSNAERIDYKSGRALELL